MPQRKNRQFPGRPEEAPDASRLLSGLPSPGPSPGPAPGPPPPGDGPTGVTERGTTTGARDLARERGQTGPVGAAAARAPGGFPNVLGSSVADVARGPSPGGGADVEQLLSMLLGGGDAGGLAGGFGGFRLPGVAGGTGEVDPAEILRQLFAQPRDQGFL